MNPHHYVVEGAASHFIDECAVISKCIRCAEHVDRKKGWVTIAQVSMSQSSTSPLLCGGVLCAACHGAFVKWMDSAQLNGGDSG